MRYRLLSLLLNRHLNLAGRRVLARSIAKYYDLSGAARLFQWAVVRLQDLVWRREYGSIQAGGLFYFRSSLTE